MRIERHKSALHRADLSRPLRQAMSDGLIRDDTSVMDYGCGRGGDVARLVESGYDCVGWDPVHAPHGERRRSSVVNLGYVVNVIEDAQERIEVLKRAWSLAENVLVVSARLENERPSSSVPTLGDGILTRIGTFQKFYEQQELRTWIDRNLGCLSVAGAPGVFYVFRRPEDRSGFVAHRFRRREPLPRLTDVKQLVEHHGGLLDGLASFMDDHGRLPEEEELDGLGRLLETFGSVRRAYRTLAAVTEPDRWERMRRVRSEDLLIYLALAKFDGRPRLGELPVRMRRDVKAFFGSYAQACGQADELLFSIGGAEKLEQAAASSQIGKLLPTALYVHVDAISRLTLPLRLYEGCARAVLGEVEDATIVKFRRDEPKISYLSYPEFERVAHPPLAESVSVHLQTFRVRTRRYARSANPPVLHRKEAFLAPDHPARGKFERLTAAEQRAGLLDETSRIGTRDGWEALLDTKGLTVRGHRLMSVSSG